MQIAIQQKQICRAGKGVKCNSTKANFDSKKATLTPQHVAGFSRIAMRESQNVICQAKQNSGD